MEFYSLTGRKRPVRLSEETRRFAFESLEHKYGLDTLKTPAVELDDSDTLAWMPDIVKYDCAIAVIAEKAPLRICEGELISGAATLGLAIDHQVPALLNGEPLFASISHLTVDFETVLRKGIGHLCKQAEAAEKRYRDTEKHFFADSCLRCLHSFRVWHERYIRALEKMPGYEENARILRKVPMEPAETFREAVQSLWFTFAFLRLCGNWPGIGRLDVLLGGYLEKDLAERRITVDEAREILAHLFIKGCEWVTGKSNGTGDAQHYQNILLAGVDENGNEVTNTVTWLTLDILEELGISDFPTTVRLNRNSDEKLLRRVAEVMRYGGGILAVYNEDLIIESLTEDGYPLAEARKFANDGCWEVQIPGKTYFVYSPFDSLAVLEHKTLCGYENTPDYPDFESLYRQYINDLQGRVGEIFRACREKFLPEEPTVWKKHIPCTVVSLFEQGCIEKGLSYLEGGPVYNIYSPHIGGLADTVNSLYAVKKLVFDDKKLTFSQLMSILKNNWEGDETFRQYVLNRYVYYGNDSDEADALCKKLLDDFAAICDSFDGKCGCKLPGGVSTFGRQLEWAPHRLAAPHGRKRGEVLAANCSPTPGTDREGATAIIRSYCKNDLKKLHSGAALDLKLLPSSVNGEDGLWALMALMRGFVALGGFFMQPDIADPAVLKAAQEHPEDYQTLSVRVSGWNARFVTLNKEWQDMVIAQTERGT